MMPEFQFLIAHGDDHSFLAAFDSRFDHHRVEILDSSQYTVVWESPTIESILQVTPASIVAVTADREVEGRGPGQARLYCCSLPECGRNPGLLLSAKEILRFHAHGDYILTWGIYDAACFSRATGRRLWQKGQIDWSEPFGSEMIAADFSSKGSKARIVSINLQTGAERVLFVRRVTKKDKTSFRPF